jgi:formiminotetrahydrofolate cyclodeaminase
MMNYCDNSLKKYIDCLSAKLPAPGGGSASALTACLGAALISMVVNFSLGKPRYARYQKELEGILEKSEKLKGEFLRLMDLDVAAYESKDVRKALDVPLMVCRLCFEAMKLCSPLIKKGNINLISDVAVAAVLLEGAFTSAYMNVEINLKNLGQVSFTKAIEKEMRQAQKTLKRLRDQTEEKVVQIIRG